ncbi:hypothetical protein HN748_03205 [Candidatus Peregrinibacteria bacterium]|jgi:hypothetical protein|nr:hypothetical protein [Candidatus Peregrinibacteria bacterium]MBT7483378.1 hypothetical protein [Candidatus Peregrinibacteria bacterium]MBT7703216.1 hypothetical protein [Candidatus Peregrinibacteria bacterium]
MCRKPAADWELAYASFDGAMPECPGRECPQACCNDKQVRTTRGVVTATTSMDPDEFQYQQGLNPPLEELGVSGQEVFVITGVMFQMQQTAHRILIQGCRDLETGKCNLEGRKPTICRMRPLEADPRHPCPDGCPKGQKILANPKTRQGVCDLSVAVGLMTEAEVATWEANAQKQLKSKD